MDANVSAKRQRTLDFDFSSVPLIDLDALPDDWEIFPWNKFPGFTTSERASRQTSWVWLHGYDIQDQTSPTKRKWVCRPCLQKPKPRISDFPSAGIQNIEKHLFREHKLVDESGKRQLALGTGLKKTLRGILWRCFILILLTPKSKPSRTLSSNASTGTISRDCVLSWWSTPMFPFASRSTASFGTYSNT
ncbi:hypothetical protein AU210_012475 [Fusarium oxysporum f. sp. radicis-cucumerinum]|uniref:BED-type domain-containing protein n=1 Tax=Fusarium oxysporum f. sp. radicis-cucumerinum TaxID=327505 RepID=A0A2H3GNY8_FUSOX|nr:hypothetical protein AU210_012475 [Fusarium oxysporum f. sp. radicis-cucumerinum]